MKQIVVVDYDPAWPEHFEHVRSRVWPAVADVALAVEHVGSTSVPGLAAKPILDITVVVPGQRDVPAVIERLATLGYKHCGDLGIEGREAFESPDALPKHHLYACPSDSLALANHLAVRKYLRTHPDAAREYGELKKQLAQRFSDDIDGYTEGKTDAILKMLRVAGFEQDSLKTIERINRRPLSSE
jgi:GrpB-like predicted nucleotidyltransferase (UPF0157 family)